MKIGVNKDRRIFTSSSSLGTENENYYEVLEFTFEGNLDNYIKYIEIYAEDEESPLKYVDRIENNEFVISNQLSKYETLQIQIICKDLENHVTYKSNIFTLTTNESLNILEDALEDQEDLFERVERELQEVYQGMEEFKTEIVEDANSRFNTNVTEKTEAFNENAESKTSDFDDNYDTKMDTFNSNYDEKLGSFNTNATSKLEQYNSNDTEKTGAYNTNATEKLSTYNTNATNKVAEYNSNAEAKLNAYNNNATEKLAEYDSLVEELHEDLDETQSKVEQYNTNIDNKYTQYNQNATTKTSEYNTNAQTKLEAYNTNATEKTAAFNENAEEKLEEYNDNASVLMQSVEELEAKHDTEVAELNEEIADLQEELDMTADLIPTDSPEPSTNITINDSARYTFKEFEVGGNSEQTTTSIEGGDEYDSPSPEHPQKIRNVGDNVNLYNNDTLNENKGALVTDGTLSNQTVWNTTDFIPVKGNKSICINKATVGNSTSFGICYYGENKDFVSGVAWNNTNYSTNKEYDGIVIETPNNSSIKYARISLRTQTDFDTLKIEEGIVATGYSPYNCGSVDVKVENKNLYYDELEIGMINNQGENASNNSMSRNKGYISLQPNTEYTISLSISANVGLRYYDSNKNFISSVSSSQAPRTFTMPENAYYLRIVLTVNDLTNKVQIEKGSTATEYIEHEEQTVTFPLSEGQVLRLGDTLEDDGVHQRRKVKVFNGTESFAYEKSGEYNRFSTPALIGVENKGNTRRDDFLCSHFTPATGNGYGLCFINRTLLYFYYNAETVEEFKAFLAEQYANGTPVTVEYELAEPIIVPYNGEQQKAYDKIKALYSYKGTTHISSDNNPSPIFTVTYRKDYTGITDARLDALEARLALLEE